MALDCSPVAPAECCVEAAVPKTTLSQEPGVVLRWEDVSYNVSDRVTKARKTIVDRSSGVVEGGQLLALMGPSGSGKTSLLDILAHRTRGKAAVSGRIAVDGREVSLSEFRRVAAYVEQEDALLGSLTVRETVVYAAALAAPCSPAALRAESADRVLQGLGLWAARDTIIGTPLKKGVSGGQKRRVSVATQLVTNPRILFLDEPTSGLDSTASYEVISSLREVARVSRTAILASIHQPSSSTFALFDLCLLLARGRTVFQGPLPAMLDFFEYAGRPCPAHVNPSEHALDVTNTDFAAGKDPELGLRDLVTSWEGSPFRHALDERASAAEAALKGRGAAEDGAPAIGGDTLRRETEESAPASRCARAAVSRLGSQLSRNVVKAVRDPLAYGARLAMYVALAALMALTFFTTPSGQAGIQTVLNSLFFSAAFLSFMCVAYVPSFIEDLAVYRRERENGVGSPLTFLAANALVGAPFLFGIALAYALIVYWAVPYRSGGFGLFLLYLFLDLLAAESMVIAVAALAPIFVVALAAAAFLNGLWMVIGGFLIPPNVLNTFWTHSFWYINYQRYVFFGLVRNEVAAQDYACATAASGGCSCMYATSLAPQCEISGEELTVDQMGFTGSPGLYIGVLIALTFGMRAIAWIILRLRS